MSEEQMKILENIQAMAHTLILETQKAMAHNGENASKKKNSKKRQLTPEQRTQLLQGRHKTAFKK